MIVVMVNVGLRLPACHSLKEKRGVTKQLVARLRRDLNVSVAEVGGLDSWQRCELGVAIVAGSETGARKVAQQVEKIVFREHRVEPVVFDIEITAPQPR
ncbi:MAG: DUF503 domain-containing protein [Actinobacteria bacterium]|nr:DUF503 domain-containing protein [Actinomycetota bacterium]